MDASVLQIGLRTFVALHVRLDGVQRGEWPIAFGAGERFEVAVLVAGQLDVRLEGFRAEGTLECSHIGVGEQMMVVDGWGFVAYGYKMYYKKYILAQDAKVGFIFRNNIFCIANY